MKESKYILETYKFEIIDCNDKTCKIKLEENDGLAFNKEKRKLYVIHDGNLILYVGEANCSIKVRFGRALGSYNHFAKTNKARGGYKGYKWLNKALNPKRSLTVTIALFNTDYDATEKRRFIEAIEGEFVFLVRKELGYWPKFQNEIHFQNEDGAKEIASKVFNAIITH
jgi:hypothetical protein